MNDEQSQGPQARDTARDTQRASGQGAARPAQQPGQQRRTSRPLSEAELQELVGTAERVPGLGKMMLDLVRNRQARVVVPETALGGELLQIVAQFDRLSRRAEVALTRELNLGKMQTKSSIDMEAVSMIQPLARLAARLANDFDNPQNNIARHPEVRRVQAELRAQARAEKAQAQAAASGEGASADAAAPRKSRDKRGAASSEAGGSSAELAQTPQAEAVAS